MSRRRTRSAPTVTELRRVEQILEADPALRARLGPKTSEVEKRSGEVIHFAPEVVKVAKALRDCRLNPERVHVHVVVAVSVDALGIAADGDSGDDDDDDTGPPAE